MAALTKPRNTDQYCAGHNYIDQSVQGVAAGVTCFHGGIASIDTATGFVGPAVAATATQIAIGRFDETVVGSAVGGEKRIRVRHGIFKYSVNGTMPKPGAKVFVLDDQTVTLTASANVRNAGVCIEVPALAPASTDELQTGEIWVQFSISNIPA